jgi:hypothetical protein
MPKKIIRWNIPTKLFRRWLAVASAIILFQLSGIYWMNNSFDDVTVEVQFAVMFFRLSRIYKLNYYVGNPARNNFKKSIEQKKKMIKKIKFV